MEAPVAVGTATEKGRVMAVEYELSGDLLRLNLAGTYQPDDVMEQFVKALEDPACPREVALLIDVTRSDSFAQRTVDDLRGVATFVGRFADRVRRRCAVVALADVHYGLARMAAVFSEGVGVEARVFRSDDEALQWLSAKT